MFAVEREDNVSYVTFIDEPNLQDALVILANEIGDDVDDVVHAISCIQREAL